MSKAKEAQKENMISTYSGELFAMFGTLWLWMYWPSFNAADWTGVERHRAVVNTFMSIVASCITTYCISAACDKKGRFTMLHLQNATLAGGVAIGSSAIMIVHPFGAMLIGTFAGLVSVLCMRYVTPFLSKNRLADNGAAVNVHGVCGLLSGFISAIVASTASPSGYGSFRRLYKVFPFMAPSNGTVQYEYFDIDKNDTITEEFELEEIGIKNGYDWGRYEQAGAQVGGTLVTVVLAVVGGFMTGIFISSRLWNQPDRDKLFNDSAYFVPTYKENDDENDKKKGFVQKVKDAVQDAS